MLQKYHISSYKTCQSKLSLIGSIFIHNILNTYNTLNKTRERTIPLTLALQALADHRKYSEPLEPGSPMETHNETLRNTLKEVLGGPKGSRNQNGTEMRSAQKGHKTKARRR